MTALAPNCGRCVFLVTDDTRCHRHAPSPSDEPLELVIWPQVALADRCGAGAEVTDGDGPQVVPCEGCVHWFVPEGGLQPLARHGKPKEWWDAAGLCTRFAPSPSGERRPRVKWRVSNGKQGCGDGEAVPLE